MANSKMLTALNEQIKHEYYSSYMYLAMSAYFAEKGLNGFAHWMRMQAEEELLHATKIYDYILSRGGQITLLAIEQPPSTWKSVMNVFEEGLKHEQFVTERINKLVDLSLSVKDHATHSFLVWFVNEQVEEEESFTDILNNLKLIKNDGHGILLLDRELASRAAPSIATTAE